MRYFIDIFSAETYQTYTSTHTGVAGFSFANKKLAAKMQVGDRIVCYLKGLGAFFAVLEVAGPMTDVSEEAFEGVAHDFPIQVPVTRLVWLSKGSLVPIRRPGVWQALSITKGVAPGAGGWSATLRRSGTRMHMDDGDAIVQLLLAQRDNPAPDGFTESDWDKHSEPEATSGRSRPLPSGAHVAAEPTPETGAGRTSHAMQALLADVGAAMGFQLWLPAADRVAVSRLMTYGHDRILTTLPVSLVSDPVALRTIEQIDVLWLHKNSVRRAFEVEHTTAVYSGILRMADLLALQPNFRTNLHLVAPSARRSKVFHELKRPAFSMYPQGPMEELCTYIPYEALQALSASPYLRSMRDDALDLVAERADTPRAVLTGKH